MRNLGAIGVFFEVLIFPKVLHKQCLTKNFIVLSQTILSCVDKMLCLFRYTEAVLLYSWSDVCFKSAYSRMDEFIENETNWKDFWLLWPLLNVMFTWPDSFKSQFWNCSCVFFLLLRNFGDLGTSDQTKNWYSEFEYAAQCNAAE